METSQHGNLKGSLSVKEGRLNLIPSFTIDHEQLVAGIYISRQDTVGAEKVTTYDIRMKAPNRETPVYAPALHTIEHLVATYLRNNEVWKDKVIYWGPMGCLTGNYLIMKGEIPCTEIRDLMIEAFQYVVDFEGEVPGTTPDACGNYLLHDLGMAKIESAQYVERLKNHFCCEYPAKA